MLLPLRLNVPYMTSTEPLTVQLQAPLSTHRICDIKVPQKSRLRLAMVPCRIGKY